MLLSCEAVQVVANTCISATNRSKLNGALGSWFLPAPKLLVFACFTKVREPLDRRPLSLCLSKKVKMSKSNYWKTYKTGCSPGFNFLCCIVTIQLQTPVNAAFLKASRFILFSCSWLNLECHPTTFSPSSTDLIKSFLYLKNSFYKINHFILFPI